MRSARNLGTLPVGRRLRADDVMELHAARLLLLFRVCGTANRIDGLTKQAKLDFFVRYPTFFERATGFQRGNDKPVESSMVRFHYGPWDPRYYHVLSFLEGAGLLVVAKTGNTIRLQLTDSGRERADVLLKQASFEPLVEQMRRVKKEFGSKTGSALKKLIYTVFSEEVTALPMGEQIRY
jgi:hypothetical protein